MTSDTLLPMPQPEKHDKRPALGSALTISERIASDPPSHTSGTIDEKSWERHYQKQMHAVAPEHKVLLDVMSTDTVVPDTAPSEGSFSRKVRLEGVPTITSIIEREIQQRESSRAKKLASSTGSNGFDVHQAKAITVFNMDSIPSIAIRSLSEKEKLLVTERCKIPEGHPITKLMLANAMTKALHQKTTIVMVEHLESSIRDKLVAYAHGQSANRGRA